MNKYRPLLIQLLSVLLAISLGALLSGYRQSMESDQGYEQARTIAETKASASETLPIPSPLTTAAAEVTEPEQTQPALIRITDPMAQELYAMDIAALQAVNPDVIGWIRIPGTNIDYPFLQAEDNAYYLDYTWDLQPSHVGAIFMECRNNPDLSDFHTILYGHNLRNRTMFSALHFYRDPSFRDIYPHVYIVMPEGVFRYEIFAAYETPKTGHTYRLIFESEEQKQEYLDECVRISDYDTGELLKTSDRILTLSTCTSVVRDDRWVVQARLEGLIENNE